MGRRCPALRAPNGGVGTFPESSSTSAPQLAPLACVGEQRAANVGDRPGASQIAVRRPNLLETLDRGATVTRVGTWPPC